MANKIIVILLALFILFSCKKKEGCTDPLAKNFDAEACKDNGSCIYTSLPETIAGKYQFNDTLFQYLQNGTLILRNSFTYQLPMKYENDTVVSITALDLCSSAANFLVKKDTFGLYNPDALCCNCHSLELKHLSFKSDTFRIIYRKNYEITTIYDVISIKGYKIE